jgi:hypothetical protein
MLHGVGSATVFMPLQGQAAFVQQWPQLALQSMQQLHPAHTAAQGRTSLAAGQQLPNRSCTCLPDPDSIIRRTQRLQQLLAACGTVGAGPGGLQHPAAAHAGQGLLYADGAGGAQAILAQAATAAESLKSAEQVRWCLGGSELVTVEAVMHHATSECPVLAVIHRQSGTIPH